MNNIVLDSMTKEDLNAVVALDANNPFAWRARNFADSLDAKNSAWILKKSGNIIGFSVWMVVIDEAHLLNIGVANYERRQGFGAFLLNEVCKKSYAFGALKIFLDVRESNLAARALYQKFGFIEIARRRNYYQLPELAEDGLVLFRTLPLAEHHV